MLPQPASTIPTGRFFQKAGNAEGLPAGRLNDILITVDGSLRVAGEDGVCRLDGGQFNKRSNQPVSDLVGMENSPGLLALDGAGYGLWWFQAD